MDFKQKPRTAARVDSNLLLGLMVGFILGLLVAIVIALVIINSPSPFSDKLKAADKAAAADTQKDASDKSAGDAKTAAGDKSRFDFYRILPGRDESPAEKTAKAATKDGAKDTAKDTSKDAAKTVSKEAPKVAAKDGAKEATSGAYLIQAGSFPNPADADNLKAKLAFIGLEATIEPATIPDKGTWYRVRLGPYSRLDDINRVRATLSQNGIEASLVKAPAR